MSRRRLMLNSSNNIIYLLKNFQFDGNTYIDTGIKLMAVNYDWKITGKVDYPPDTLDHTLIDCNNEATTTEYGTSAMGITVRVLANTARFEIKLGNGSAITQLERLMSGSDSTLSTGYGYALRRTIVSNVTEVEFEIIKQGTTVTIRMGNSYCKLKWTGNTLKNLYIGCNVVENTGVTRRYYKGYLHYLILEKI